MTRRRGLLQRTPSTTVGILGLIGLWTAFQVFDSNPPTVLDQLLVAAFTVWFAAEAKRNSSAKRASDDDDETAADDDGKDDK